MLKFADVVVGLAWGDEAKGKITSSLVEERNYDIVARWAGGNNAGHTVYVNGKKYKTHLIPSGVFHGVKSVIGPGCVLHPKSFDDELSYLSENGFDTSLVKVSPKCHIIADDQISFDKKNLAARLGTTSRGIAPAYAAKAARTGITAYNYYGKDSSYIWDEQLDGKLLCEGAQGVWLDLDHGNYPYVTSSTTITYGACSIGFPHQKIRQVWGAAKIYDTRSGEDPDFPESLFDDITLSDICNIGGEIGVTTGRRRKVNWLNVDKLILSINISGCTNIVISKCDVLDEVGAYNLYSKNKLLNFKDMHEMQEFLSRTITNNCEYIKDIIYSYTPEGI
jgi:adenylosuccinate synthase